MRVEVWHLRFRKTIEKRGTIKKFHWYNWINHFAESKGERGRFEKETWTDWAFQNFLIILMSKSHLILKPLNTFESPDARLDLKWFIFCDPHLFLCTCLNFFHKLSRLDKTRWSFYRFFGTCESQKENSPVKELHTNCFNILDCSLISSKVSCFF